MALANALTLGKLPNLSGLQRPNLHYKMLQAHLVSVIKLDDLYGPFQICNSVISVFTVIIKSILRISR